MHPVHEVPHTWGTEYTCAPTLVNLMRKRSMHHEHPLNLFDFEQVFFNCHEHPLSINIYIYIFFFTKSDYVSVKYSLMFTRIKLSCD